MSKTVNSKILLRRDTSTNWSANNPILAAGQVGFDTTLGKHKIGDGTTRWNSLPYFALMTDVDTSAGSASYSTIVGDGTTTSFTITHGLDTKNLVIQCYDINTTTGTLENIIGYYTILGDNSIQVDLSYAPVTNGLKVAIITANGDYGNGDTNGFGGNS